MVKPFYETLTDAVADMLDNGFTSIHQLDNWLTQIRASAKLSLVPEYEVEKSITNNMRGIYERLIVKGNILQQHPEIKLFQLDKVKPKLRKELDKAILTNAKLVKLNRERVINQTLQRFSGWATSIPTGGSKVADKRAIKQTIRKQLASLPFEERRVAIDQGHKFVESLNRIIAVDNDAIAGIWRSRWRRPGYQYRKEHKERDGKIYAIRDNWAIKARLMKKGRYGFLDEYEQAGELPYCFPADSKIPYSNLIEKGFRRWYSGELTEIVMSSGKTIRATPNHKILTTCGWKEIGLLNVGDNVIEVTHELTKSFEEDQDNHVPTISEIFRTLQKDWVVHPTEVSPTEFDCDAFDCNINVVCATRELLFDTISRCPKSRGKFVFSKPFISASLVPNFSSLKFFSNRLNSIFNSGMGIFYQGLSLFCRSFCIPKTLGFNVITQNNFIFNIPGNSSAGNPKSSRDSQDAFPLKVKLGKGFKNLFRVLRFFSNFWLKIKPKSFKAIEQCLGLNAETLSDNWDRLPFSTTIGNIVKVNTYGFSGHVYNLQTDKNWYVADGIIAHNCSCSVQYIYNLTSLPEDMLTDLGKKEIEKALIGMET